MPWKALPWDDCRKDELFDLFKVSGIPSLIIVDPSSGAMISKNGQASVLADPSGMDFPWHPKALNELDSGFVDVINCEPVVICFDTSQTTRAVLAQVAEAAVAADRAVGAERPLHWFWAGNHDLVKYVKQFAKLTDECMLCVLDVRCLSLAAVIEFALMVGHLFAGGCGDGLQVPTNAAG